LAQNRINNLTIETITSIIKNTPNLSKSLFSFGHFDGHYEQDRQTKATIWCNCGQSAQNRAELKSCFEKKYVALAKVS
jgi:hypothetical protein